MSNYVVIDLEMCNTYQSISNRTMRYKTELIQIGAVSLDENFNVKDSFVTYVSPEFGRIDRKINHLTGISAEDIKDAPSAQEALESFTLWLPDTPQFVAWSENDERQIRKEFKRKQFDIPALSGTFGNWIDCQQIFAEKLNATKRYKLSEALSIADISYDDGAHDALVDARNTAKLFAKLKSGETLEVSTYFISADNSREYAVNPFAVPRRSYVY